jgi:short subunit fatty acids transporter
MAIRYAQCMAVATESAKRKRRKPMARRKSNTSWWILLPTVVGILITPATLHVASILALSGMDALTMLYPWVVVMKSPVLRISLATTIPVDQWALYLQFPVYGLVMTLMLRTRRFGAALVTVLAIHGVGIGLAYLLNYLQGSAPPKIF